MSVLAPFFKPRILLGPELTEAGLVQWGQPMYWLPSPPGREHGPLSSSVRRYSKTVIVLVA